MPANTCFVCSVWIDWPKGLELVKCKPRSEARAGPEGAASHSATLVEAVTKNCLKHLDQFWIDKKFRNSTMIYFVVWTLFMMIGSSDWMWNSKLKVILDFETRWLAKRCLSRNRVMLFIGYMMKWLPYSKLWDIGIRSKGRYNPEDLTINFEAELVKLIDDYLIEESWIGFHGVVD